MEGGTVVIAHLRYPVTVRTAEALGSAVPVESEAIDKGVKGNTMSMAEDVRKEEGTVTPSSDIYEAGERHERKKRILELFLKCYQCHQVTHHSISVFCALSLLLSSVFISTFIVLQTSP